MVGLGIFFHQQYVVSQVATYRGLTALAAANHATYGLTGTGTANAGGAHDGSKPYDASVTGDADGGCAFTTTICKQVRRICWKSS